MPHIRLQTEIPGPQSRRLLDRRRAATPAGLGRSTDVVVERAEGALVQDVDGNTLIDFAGGIGMLNAGHCPPAVVRAIQAQAAECIHVCAMVATYEPYVALCEKLNQIVPGTQPKRTLLASLPCATAIIRTETRQIRYTSCSSSFAASRRMKSSSSQHPRD